MSTDSASVDAVAGGSRGGPQQDEPQAILGENLRLLANISI